GRHRRPLGTARRRRPRHGHRPARGDHGLPRRPPPRPPRLRRTLRPIPARLAVTSRRRRAAGGAARKFEENDVTQSPNPVDVLIVGGGIGGLSAAFALAREGLRVRVLEQASEFGEVGAGLQIAPNCTRILDDYGLLDEAKRRGVLPKAMLMRDAVDGSELTRLDLVDRERGYGFPYMVIHRSDLHGIFLDACRRADVDLVTGARVTGYANTASGAQVRLADGRTDEAGLVIAADGLHSVARGLLSDDAPVNSSYVAYRAAIPIEKVNREVDLTEVSVHVR